MKIKRFTALFVLLLVSCCLLSACMPAALPSAGAENANSPVSIPAAGVSAPQGADVSALRSALLCATESPVDETLLRRFNVQPEWFQSVLDTGDACGYLRARYQNPVTKEIFDFEPLNNLLYSYELFPIESPDFPEEIMEIPAISDEERLEKMMEVYRFLIQDFTLGEGRTTRIDTDTCYCDYDIAEYLEDDIKSGTVVHLTCSPSGQLISATVVKGTVYADASAQGLQAAAAAMLSEEQARNLANQEIAAYWAGLENVADPAPVITGPGTIDAVGSRCDWVFEVSFPCPCQDCVAGREEEPGGFVYERLFRLNIDVHTGECTDFFKSK